MREYKIFVHINDDGYPEFRAGSEPLPDETVYWYSPGSSFDSVCRKADEFINQRSYLWIFKYQSMEEALTSVIFDHGLALIPLSNWPFATEIIKIGGTWYALINVSDKAFNALE